MDEQKAINAIAAYLRENDRWDSAPDEPLDAERLIDRYLSCPSCGAAFYGAGKLNKQIDRAKTFADFHNKVQTTYNKHKENFCEDDKPFFTQSDLKKRGWTQGLISRLLGHCDQTRPNPMHPNLAPMLLYARDSVTTAEHSDAFKDSLARSIKTANTRKQGTKIKAQCTESLLKGLLKIAKWEILEREKSQLLDEAVHWQEGGRQLIYSGYDPRNPKTDEERKRSYSLVVRYLENNVEPGLTKILQYLRGAKLEQFWVDVRLSVLESIQEKYPWLRETCEEQIQYLTERREYIMVPWNF